MPRKYERKTNKANWTEEQLEKALESIKNGEKIRKVSRTFGIHEATLRTRMKAKTKSGPKMGRKPTFSAEQENEIKEHIIKMAKLFYGVSCLQLRRIAFQYAEANNIQNNFDKSAKLAGKDWLALFLKRNPSISLRKPEPTSLNRVQAFNQEEVNTYFRNLEQVFEKYKFKEGRIYNVDETGINTVQRPERILAPKGVKQIGGVTSWERGKNVTAICCFSAAGTYVAPMFIFPRKRMTPLLSKGGPVGAIYGCSVNGWSNESLFYQWIQHFQNNVKSSIEDPVLLVLDNHNSHISLEIFDFCKQHGIVMVTIPPHTSHKLQPLDVTFFSSLKAAFNRECDLYMKSRVYEKITPYELAELFNKAYVRVATMDKGQSGFRSCGIWPLNPDKFQDIDGEPCESFRVVELEVEETLSEETEREIDEVTVTNQPEREEAQFQGSSKEDVHVNIAEISPIPMKKNSVQQRSTKGRPRGKSLILTATPEKIKLQMQLSIKKEKQDTKKGSKTKNVKKLLKPKLENNKNKQKSAFKKKIKLDCESSSGDDLSVDSKDICDDDSVRDLDLNEDVCLVCSEFGKDGEVWFRCVVCSQWSHEECSGWDSPENYTCDVCLSRNV